MSRVLEANAQKPHPRVLGWFGTTCIAMGGSNQSLFLISALLIGQGSIPGQGSIAIALLGIGLLISYAQIPGWLELTLMFPNRVGGIAATCAEAFRPYSEVLANLAGVCYWWGWIPTCGISALISGAAINQWYLPSIPVPVIATCLVVIFTLVNLRGIHFASMVAIPIAAISAGLALLSGLIPVFTGQVDWVQASTLHLTLPFEGMFGQVTSLMAGLYLIGFAAPAFEQATCHTGEQENPKRDQTRSIYASAAMAGVYFVFLPVVWLGVLGPESLSKDLTTVLGPTFAPIFGSFAKSAAIWFVIFNLFHDTLAPLAGATRTLSQLADDGLLPRIFGRRSTTTDTPVFATIFTAAFSIIGLWMGDPLWLIAAANFTYLIGICLPSIAVWLLRKDQPDRERTYRAPRGTIALGLVSVAIWSASTVLGFQQFGLSTVLLAVVFAYSGAVLYAWRKASDRHLQGLPTIAKTIHIKLTGAMVLVLIFDAAGYYLAVSHIRGQDTALLAALSDIFVFVAVLTIAVGLIIPGMIAHAVVQVTEAARKMANGVLTDFAKALTELGRGNLDAAHVRVEIDPIKAYSRDEISELASSFNELYEKTKSAALGLDAARNGVGEARDKLLASHTALQESEHILQDLNRTLEKRVMERTSELEKNNIELSEEIVKRKVFEEKAALLNDQLVVAARRSGMEEIATSVVHNIGNVVNSINISANIIDKRVENSKMSVLPKLADLLRKHESNMGAFITNDPSGKHLPQYFISLADTWASEKKIMSDEIESLKNGVHHIIGIVRMQQSLSTSIGVEEEVVMSKLLEDSLALNKTRFDGSSIRIVKDLGQVKRVVLDRVKLLQVTVNLIKNAYESLIESQNENKELRIVLQEEDSSSFVIRIIDNGIGISPAGISRIFAHGFTTKKSGHGFGLHNSALAAIEMGGTLTVKSLGLNLGAEFILTLPYIFRRQDEGLRA